MSESAGTELGKAYVQIVPSAKGISAAVREILGDSIPEEGQKVGEKTGFRLGSAIKTALAAAGIGTAIKSAFSEGSALEQNLGGVETLFDKVGKSWSAYANEAINAGKMTSDNAAEIYREYLHLSNGADIVKENAKNAFKTAGLSANEYIETVNSFSASLLSSLDNDTIAAANAADQAVTDMSDNANKMGTDMQSIQNAYQGFAKQNFTMLDNLKLGYGGTKTEMERLLADAQKLSGVEYNIDNLADVYSAIHVIQDELGITGTTAKEASETFSGSFASMKAAAKNLLGDLATGEDISGDLENLADTAVTFFADNMLPMLGNVLKNVPKLIVGAFSKIGEHGGDIANVAVNMVQGLVKGLQEGIPTIAQIGISLLNRLAASITENLPQLIPVGMQALVDFTSTLRDNFGMLVDAGLDVVMALADALIDNLPVFIETIPIIITNICGLINDNAPKLIAAGIQIIVSLALGLIQAIPTIVENIPQIIQAIISVFTAFNWINLGSFIIKAIGDGVHSLASSLPNAFKNIGETAKNALKNINWSGLGSQIINLIKSAISELAHLIPNALKAIGTSAVNLFKGINWGDLGVNIIKGIMAGISAAKDALFSLIKNLCSGLIGSVKNFLGIHSPSTEFAWIGEMLDAGLAQGIEKNTKPITDAITDVNRLTMSRFKTDIAVTSTIEAAAGNGRTGDSESHPEAESTQGRSGITIIINAAPGQDVNELADEVSARLEHLFRRKEAGLT